MGRNVTICRALHSKFTSNTFRPAAGIVYRYQHLLSPVAQWYCGTKMTITEIATLELLVPHTWDSPDARTFVRTLSDRQSAWSGHSLFFFKGADSPGQIFLISGWKSVQTHNEWIASAQNQGLLEMTKGLVEVRGLVHADINFEDLPRGTRRIVVEVIQKGGGGEASTKLQKTRSVEEDERHEWAASGEVLDGGAGAICRLRAYAMGETDLLSY